MTHDSGRDSDPRGRESAGVRISDVFRRALAPVRAALAEYRVPEQTVASVETDLAAWLIRYAKRSPDASYEAKILALVSLACSFGRGYQARVGEPGGDRKVAALLAENPDAVAARISAAFGVGPAIAPSRVDLWTRMRALARRNPDRDREE